ncbi:MAG: SRPBCC family protein [Halolamina sp.]
MSSQVRTVATDAGRRLSVERVVAAGVESAWERLVALDEWPSWGPTVHAVDAGGAETVRPGLTGRVRVGPTSALATWASFEITDCTAPGEGGEGDAGDDTGRWRWTVAGVAATGHVVAPVADGRARVAFRTPPWAVGYVPVLKRGLAAVAEQVESA